MSKNILITGGAGFIGSHLADALLRHGHRVRALDNLSPQIHGDPARRPSYLNADVELQVGDIRDSAVVKKALETIDVVYHLAAMVGVGQSMYQMRAYTDVNNVGTATLLEAVAATPVERFIVASSMSIYGEGQYVTSAGEPVLMAERTLEQLKRADWEPRDSVGRALRPQPTPESKLPSLASIYALSKFDQERLCLLVGQAYGVSSVALRFFNVYGPHQALSNPYTGVLAIFASRLLNDKPPLIFEDGLQQRDFVSVHDVARACVLAMDAPAAVGRAINIGSGDACAVRDVAVRVSRLLGRSIAPVVTGRYRVGDIRHCFADVTLARETLGYRPLVALEEGLTELAGWLEGQIPQDYVERASQELAARGLTV